MCVVISLADCGRCKLMQLFENGNWNPRDPYSGMIRIDETCHDLVVRAVTSSERDHVAVAVNGTKMYQYFSQYYSLDLCQKKKLR